MTFERFLMWTVLVIGVVFLGQGLLEWRSGARKKASQGIMFIALAGMNLGSGWVHYASVIVLVPFFVNAAREIFTQRDQFGLWITLPFIVIILAVAATEMILDDIALWQRLVMGAIAVFAATALATTIVRLTQARRARRATA